MKLSEFEPILLKIIASELKSSVFMWGAPGIGKSSVVRSVATQLNLELIDVRLSQLAPTDLRGLPIISTDSMKWATPNFLPTESDSRGVLFLDEFNMCSGSMMGIAQQLILDRKVGDYSLPAGWTIIAAGNRASDRAAVSVMPAPVANRFIHFHLDAHLDDFKTVAYSTFAKNGISAHTIGQVLGFLNFKPDLLNTPKIGASDLQFPTPRSWENAMRLIDLGIEPEHAIGEATSIQLKAYLRLYSALPNLDNILAGKSEPMRAKSDPSVIYAVVSSLISKSETTTQYVNALAWILNLGITQDFCGLFVSESMTKLRASAPDLLPQYVNALLTTPSTREFIQEYRDLISSFNP